MRWFTRNILHGATKNPAFPGLTPGGSSDGAASAVGSGLGPLAHGTDIAGSIRHPAGACGIHGRRPGLVRVPAFNAPAGDRLIGSHGSLDRLRDEDILAFPLQAAATTARIFRAIGSLDVHRAAAWVRPRTAACAEDPEFAQDTHLSGMRTR